MVATILIVVSLVVLVTLKVAFPSKPTPQWLQDELDEMQAQDDANRRAGL